MYDNPVCEYRSRKDDTYRISLTISGDKLTYSSYSGSIAATLLETKIFLTASFQTLVPNFFAQISKTIFSAQAWNASNTPKYLSDGLPKKYALIITILYCGT